MIEQRQIKPEDLPVKTLQHMLHYVFGKLFRAVKYGA
jgi:hypothetical protein